MVTKSELIAMRRYLPHEEYRLLKNRKSARLCRIKRKAERNNLQKKSYDFEDENQMLREALQRERLVN